jgi:hypothetical protein
VKQRYKAVVHFLNRASSYYQDGFNVLTRFSPERLGLNFATRFISSAWKEPTCVDWAMRGKCFTALDAWEVPASRKLNSTKGCCVT